ncbi:homoserine kinase [Hamadaea tsunoensis]|uniref:homoserine kinase n=1 Tax=Hamadaea tsunoensis TaxID=53368 RepID=UPI000427376A|nr:homoserine kinase [Hamadaea tsunoensis]
MPIDFPSGPVTVRAPATSANLGPGFDALGLALTLYDEVTAEIVDSDTTVEVAGEGAGQLPGDESHLVVRAMRTTFEHLGAQPKGIRLRCVNRIPQARGLGSSSAAIVAGVTLAQALAGMPDRAQALRIAGEIEGHPDNVAPCVLGGFTIAWLDEEHQAHAVSTSVDARVEPVVFVPRTLGLTAEARAALPPTVPHRDAAFNAGRSALLVYALAGDPGLLHAATEDRLHQAYRAGGMPETARLVAELRAAGVAAVVSGAGPTVLALTGVPSGFVPGPGWVRHKLGFDLAGARLTR